MKGAARVLANRVLLPCLGVLLVLSLWEATLLAYHLPAIVLPSSRLSVVAMI